MRAAKPTTAARPDLGLPAVQGPQAAGATAAARSRTTGIPLTTHPIAIIRPRLDQLGASSAAALAAASHGARTLVGGLVTHRQRPHTAGGTVFLSLEDETGLVNVICPPWVWQRHRRVARTVPAVLVRGRLEREGLVINLIAETIEPLTAPGAALAKSRDFR